MPNRQSDYSSDREQSEGASSRNDIQRSLGRIEGKLDAMGLSFIEHIRDDEQNFKELKLRVASMEKKLWSATGALGLLYGLVTYFKP